MSYYNIDETVGDDKLMKFENWTLWEKLAFRTQTYRKNFDLIDNGDRFITEHNGTISRLRFTEHKVPATAGEYGLTTINVDLACKSNIPLDNLIEDLSIDDNIYSELTTLISNNDLNIYQYNKILLIHTFILHKDYRKKGVVEEFIEMIYHDHYSEDSLILMLVKPIQNNSIDNDYIIKHKTIEHDGMILSGYDYYQLSDFEKKDDIESNQYRLFAVATRCGFSRIKNSNVFIFNPKKTIKRLTMKNNYIEQMNNNNIKLL